MKYTETGLFPCGELTVISDGDGLTSVFRGGSSEQEPDALTHRALEELHEYFDGKRREFDLPLHPNGTEFRRKVWDVMMTIPFGKVMTYGEVARKIGKPKAARAVSGAVGANPILIIIPCHRVVAVDGVGGFSAGADMKRVLLSFEGHR